MSQDQPLAIPSQDRLQEIRDADTAVGPHMQMCPASWQQRRELLVLLDSRTKRFIDGETLYAFFTSSRARRNLNVFVSWEEISDDGRDVWNEVAENITQGFQQ